MLQRRVIKLDAILSREDTDNKSERANEKRESAHTRCRLFVCGNLSVNYLAFVNVCPTKTRPSFASASIYLPGVRGDNEPSTCFAPRLRLSPNELAPKALILDLVFPDSRSLAVFVAVTHPGLK